MQLCRKIGTLTGGGVAFLGVKIGGFLGCISAVFGCILTKLSNEDIRGRK